MVVNDTQQPIWYETITFSFSHMYVIADDGMDSVWISQTLKDEQ